MQDSRSAAHAAVLFDGAIAPSLWEAVSPEARLELVRVRSWFPCVRGALLADVFSLDDALVSLTVAFMRGAERMDAARLLAVERRLRGRSGLARKGAAAEPLVRRFADDPEALLADLRRCADLERLLRSEPCWFAPAEAPEATGPTVASALFIGRGGDALAVDERIVEAWAALLTTTRASVEGLRAALPPPLADGCATPRPLAPEDAAS